MPAIAILVALLLFCAPSGAGPVVYVDASAAGGDGASPESAFQSIQAAIDALGEEGGEVVVAAGEYRECVRLRSRVALRGVRWSDAPASASAPAVVIRSPDGSTPVVIDSCRDVIISDVAVTGSRRCGVYIARGGVTLERVCVFANIAGIRGGGIGRPPSKGRRIIAPDRVEEGGGVSVWDSDVVMTACCLKGNSAAIRGGGIWIDGGAVEMARCLITGNDTEDAGGGVCIWSGRLDLASCVIEGNWAYRGGGLFCGRGSSAVVRGCTFVGNGARRTGGVYAAGGSVQIDGCIFWSNGADLSGATPRRSCIRGGDAAAGNISSDPCLGGPGGYHLSADSPCIDAWAEADAPDDIDGQARDAAADMGADEFVREGRGK